MKMLNQVKMTFASRSVNESFSRAALAAFLAQADPTVPQLADIKTAVSEAVTNCIVHCLSNVRDTNAFIRYGNAHIAALIQNSRHRNGADGIRIGMDDAVGDSF